MELIWPEASPWRNLQVAIQPALERIHRSAGALGVLTISEGDGEGPLAMLRDGGLVLRPDLVGPDMFTREDAAWRASVADTPLAALALDRWRRAAGLLAEALLVHDLAQRLGASPAAVAGCWWLCAQVADQVDRLDPELGWLWPETVDLLRFPQQDQRAAPRRLAWLVRWLRLRGSPLPERLSPPPPLSAGDWAAFGVWCRDPAHGPAAVAPLPLPLAVPRDHLPSSLSPLSLYPVRLRPGPAGLWLGSDAVPRGLAGETEGVVVLACTAEGQVPSPPQPAPVVGRWGLLSGAYGSRTGGARGVDLVLSADGSVEITFANAFVGPLSGDALSLASQFGASGFGGGRWRLTRLEEPEGQQGELVLRQLSVEHLTIHPRKGLKFALPGQGWQERLRGALTRLNDRPMRFTLRGDELLLSCTIRDDAELFLRFQRAETA